MDFDEETPDEISPSFKPSYVLVAIDTHRTMFVSDGAPSPFKNSLKAVYRLCDALLLKSDKRGWSPFSIVLCDKEEKASLVDFKDNMIQTNKLLKEKSSLTENELKDRYMRDYDLDLAAFFQLCKKKFKDVSSTFYKRIMLFITDDPDPVNGDANKRFTALNEAKNFEENDIAFQLIVTKEDFNFDIFYNELSSLLKQPRVEIICEDEEGLYEKLTSTIWFRHSQRKLPFYPFADDLSKYISVYKKSYIKYNRLLNNSFVATDGTVLKRVVMRSDVKEEETLQGNQSYVLTNKETRKKFMELEFDFGDKLEAAPPERPIGYVLLYVCQRLSGLGEVIAEPRILEVDAKEQLPYFKQFWQHCVNNDKVLVCAQTLKKGEKPRAVELIPKLTQGNKVFLIKGIAFANEIFEPPVEPIRQVNLTQAQKDVMDKLIERLTFDFSCSFLVDEGYVRKEKYIKSKLLDEPREEVDCREFLTPQEIDEKIEDIIGEYLECFPPEQGTKRKRAERKKK